MTRKGKVFKEKKLKNSIEIKSEKGSITVFVLSIMLFLITVVVMSYMGISSRMSEQGKQVEKIQAEYNGNTEKMNSIYKELHDESKLYVIYDSNGGEGGPEVQQKTYGETLKLSSETPKRVGYHCTGWSINKDKNSVDYEPGANYEKNATIKLYAVWEANEYTIQYDGNGATSGSTESSIHIYDEDKALTKNNFVRKGYTFKGWSTKKNGSVEYTDEQEVINLSEEHGAKVILYAVWQKNSYTVTYNYTENGGTSATKTSDEINYGSAIDLTPTATKSGYTFVGWNTNKDGTSKLSSLTMGTSNVTLYAIYSKTITATCYYYSGSAQTSKTVSNTIYNKTTSTTLALGTTSLTGYTFRGWSTSNSGNATISVASNGSASLSSNATYYACYSYTVTGTYKYYNGKAYTSSTATATAYMNSSGTKVGGKPTAPTVSNPSGWTARGWSKATEANTSSISIPGTITENTTYYYSWSKTVTVSYNSNGGNGAPSSQSTTAYLNYDGTSSMPTAITISSTIPTKTGYAFEGWGTSTSSTTASYNSGSKYSNASSINLYAIWKLIIYEVSYTENSKIITKYADTLSEALEFADISTIKACQNVNETNQVQVPDNKTITLNTNSKTLDVSLKNYGNLTILGNGTLKLDSANDYVIRNYANTNIDNITINSISHDAIVNEKDATMNLMNSKVCGKKDQWTINNLGILNLQNSLVSLEISGGGVGAALYNTSGTLNISNVTITSDAYGLIVDTGKANVNNFDVDINGIRDGVLVRNTGAADLTNIDISASNAAICNDTSAWSCRIWSRDTNYGIHGSVEGKVIATTNVDAGKDYESITIYGDDSANLYFPTWTALNSQDDIEWIRSTISNNKHTATIYKSKHNNETGQYYVDVWTADSQWKTGSFVCSMQLFF